MEREIEVTIKVSTKGELSINSNISQEHTGLVLAEALTTLFSNQIEDKYKSEEAEEQVEAIKQ